MYIVAMESQCIKTIRTHLVDKIDFILSDHDTGCKSFLQFYLSSERPWTVISPALSLPSRKFQSIGNKNLAKRLKPYFAGWYVRLLLRRAVSFLFQNYCGFSRYLALCKTERSLQTGLQDLLLRNLYYTFINRKVRSIRGNICSDIQGVCALNVKTNIARMDQGFGQ